MTNEDLKKMILDDGLYETVMYSSTNADELEDDETHRIYVDLFAAINALEEHIGL